MSEEETYETPDDVEHVVASHEDELEHAIDEATDTVVVQTNELSELQDASTPRDGKEIGHLLDVPVEVTVELGHGRMSLGELAKLDTGSLVRLDREAHEPAAILVNGKVVAHGEIVTIGESYGVRISRVHE